MVLSCLSLIISDVKHLYMYLLAISISFTKSVLIFCPFFDQAACVSDADLHELSHMAVGACVLSLSVVSDSVIPSTVAHQAPLSTGFPRQEYWSGLPSPSPGDLPKPGIKPKSFASPDWQADSLPLVPSGRPIYVGY